MLARRFLGCVFVLTVIVAIAAFALFQFGGRALTRMATPTGHYVAPAPSDAPDYADTANWLARPELSGNASNWLPAGFASEVVKGDAAVFFVHPTTYLERDRWNAPLTLTGDAAGRAELFVRSQGSAFNGAGAVWAPRYRQAAYGAFLLKSGDATKALDLAYRDVLGAFDAFLAAQPADRPLILAGHSQGSLHLSRLLVDRRAALKGRLVAAYVAGWPLSVTADLPAMGLPGCAAPDATGCVLSWQSFGEPASPALVLDAWLGTTGYGGGKRQRGDMLCVNPLTGKSGREPASPALNPGTLLPDARFSGASLAKGRVGARCDDGFLKVTGAIPPMGPYVLPGNNYHVYDYALFWGAIRADAARRLRAWTAAR